MRLECGRSHARKRWSWEFEDFEKDSVEIGLWRQIVKFSALWGIQLSFLPLRRRLSFSDLDRRRWIEILKHHKTHRALGMVSIVRIVSLSLRVAMNRSYQKQQSPSVFCIYVLCYCCDWDRRDYATLNLRKLICHHHHHHHHVVPLARISLTLSRHFFRSFIASGRFSGLHPVSSHSCCMYFWAGRPAFARPYVGVHRSTSLMGSSLLLQQSPECLVMP